MIGVFSNAFVTERPPDAAHAVLPPPPPAPRVGPAATRAGIRRAAVGEARRRLRKALGYPLFWSLRALYTGLALSEPLVVGLRPLLDERVWSLLQLVLLGLSTALYTAQMFGTYRFIDDGEAPGASRRTGRLWLLFSDGASLFETVCLCLGWALVVERPGLAALRCFRVFRVLWFFNVARARSKAARSAVGPVSIPQLCCLAVEVMNLHAASCLPASTLLNYDRILISRLIHSLKKKLRYSYEKVRAMLLRFTLGGSPLVTRAAVSQSCGAGNLHI